MNALEQSAAIERDIRHAEALLEQVAGGPREILNAALALLAAARANLAIVRLALRQPELLGLLQHHNDMSLNLRVAATRAGMSPGRGLYLAADEHHARAEVLRALIGPADAAIVADAAEPQRETPDPAGKVVAFDGLKGAS